MEEHKIKFIEPDKQSEADKLVGVDNAFTDKDFITEADTEIFAQNVADSIKSKIEKESLNEEEIIEFIINILESKQILHGIAKGESEVFTFTKQKKRNSGGIF